MVKGATSPYPNIAIVAGRGLYRPDQADLSRQDQWWYTQFENNLQGDNTLLMMEDLLLSERELELLLQSEN